MPKEKKSSGFNSPRFPSVLLRALFFIVPVLFYTGAHDPFFIKESLAQTILVFLTLYWTAHSLSASDFKFRSYPLLLPFLFFIAAQILSLINAEHRALAAQSAWQQTLLLGLYVSCIDLADAPAQKKIESSLLWASAIAGIYGALQHFGVDMISWSTHWQARPASTFGNPNFAAGWWIMILPLFAARLTAKGENRAMSVLVLILGALNLYWGRTAGAWAALAVSVGIVAAIFFSLKVLSWKKSTSLLFFLALGLGLFSAAFHLSARLNPGHQSIEERILKWRTAGKMIADHPVFGIGAGNVKVRFALYQADVSRAMNRSLAGTSESNVHNEYLQIASESGVLGLAAFLSIFGVWFYRRTKDEKWTPQGAGSLAAILAFLFYSLTNFPYRIPSNACLLIYFLAVSEKKEEPGGAAPQKSISNAVYAAIFIAGAGIFWKWIWPPFKADLLRDKAYALQAQQDYAQAAALFERAIALDFYRSERTAYELGECRRAQGDIPKAIEAYKISTQLRNYGEVYNNIGNCYYLLGRFSDAKENWRKAVDLQLPDPGVRSQTIENIKAVERLNPDQFK